MIAHAYGCQCHIAMPDDAAQEKGLMLEALGEYLQQSLSPHLMSICLTEQQQASLRNHLTSLSSTRFARRQLQRKLRLQC